MNETLIIGVSKGAPGMPPGSKLFHFHAVLGKKKLQNSRLTHPLWELEPPNPPTLTKILDPPLLIITEETVVLESVQFETSCHHQGHMVIASAPCVSTCHVITYTLHATSM